MNAAVSPLDAAIVVVYIVATTLIGPWFARRQRDVKTYFVGGRDMPWWLVLFSIVGTETSTVTFLSVPGLAFREGGNLMFLQLAMGYVIGRVVISLFLLPQYFRGELFSAYQVLRERFSPAVQRTASGLFLATRTVADGLRLFLTALLLHQFTGWSSDASVLVMGLAILAFTYLGGMEAVIWNDLIQFVIYIAGALLAAGFILSELPGGWDEFVRTGREAGKFALFDTVWDPTRAFNLWAGVIGGAVFTMASHGADQLMVQRYLCSRSLGQARAALTLSGLVVLVQFLLFLLIGVGLFALNRSDLQGLRNDEIFGFYIVRALPVGIVGVVIAAVLAAAMSSSLNSSASAFVSDFYRPLRPSRAEGHYLNVSRVMTAVWGAAQIGVALVTLRLPSDRSVIDLVLSVAGFTTGMILGLFILGSLSFRVSSRAALIGLIIGFFTVLLVWVPSEPAVWTRLAAHFSDAEQGLPEFLEQWARLKVAWPWFAAIGTTTTVVVALLVHLVSFGHGPSANRGTQPGLDQPR